MINLLPPEAKKELAAGRANRLLLRYQVMFLVLSGIMLLVFVFFYLHLRGSQQSYQETVDENIQASGHMADSQKNVTEFRSNLATAKQILDKQINYSAVSLRVASVIPSGVILDQLTLDPETVNQPVKLNARARNDQAVQNLKNALNTSEYFNDAYYDTVSRNASDTEYPFSITMTVTFTQELLSD